MYEAKVHVFIYCHTRSEQAGLKYRCLSSTVDWWVDELMQLWSSRALTYDISRKQNFVIRAALMWTINDFTAYEMVSGWSTHGKLACPYCMKNNKAFKLNVNHIERLETNIVETLCKLEMIFPPSFLTQWSISPYIYRSRQKLEDRSSIDGCIHSNG